MPSAQNQVDDYKNENDGGQRLDQTVQAIRSNRHALSV